MMVSNLWRCHDALLVLARQIEISARALGDAIDPMEPATRLGLLGPLQINDITVQRCAHVVNALAVLATWGEQGMVALGCRLQVRQLAQASADFRSALEALRFGLTDAGPADEDGRVALLVPLDAAALGLEAEKAALDQMASALPEGAPGMRQAVVERLNPAYTMAGERAILAQFLAGETSVLGDAVAATEEIEDFFL